MSWTNDYMAIPFVDGGRDHHGCDCYGLVRLILLERYNIHLPILSDAYGTTADWQAISCAIDTESSRPCWTKLEGEQAQEGDVVVFRVANRPWHVGLMLDHDEMLNIAEGGLVRMESITGPLWGRRLDSIYRYSG